MGCMSHRRRDVEIRPEQKWDYITLQDFKSRNCLTPFAYAYLYFSLLLSLAVYSVDTFTAVQLLVFDRWGSQIEPTQLIPFDVSKWIFSICIILSVINLAFEHLRANRIMRRGAVAESYLDNLAVKLESVRLGSGRGWKRFLVFAELTKSKKGAEYIALFTYFSFQSWIRVVICSGPRQVINAMTLLSVYNAKISATGDNVGNTLVDFFDKVKALAEDDYEVIIILSGMLFTLVIWVFSALSLLLATLFFVFFLWGWIPKSDGGLSGYCERKINKRLMKIVAVKVNKAIVKEEENRKRAELRAAKKAGEAPPEERKATLPVLAGGDDGLPEMPMMKRTDTGMTGTTLAYTPGTVSTATFELNPMDQRRPMPSRTGTANSAFSSQASLLGNAAEPAGYRSASPAPSLPQIDLSNYPPARPGTSFSNRSFGGPPPPLSRAPTFGTEFGASYTQTPSAYSSEMMPSMPPPVRSPTAPTGNYGGMPPRQAFDNYSNGRSSPAPSMLSNRGGPRPPRPFGPGGMPPRSATNPVPPRGPGAQYPPPQRNMTAPMGPRHQPQGSDASGMSVFSQRSGPSAGEFHPYNPAHRAQNSGEYRPYNAAHRAQDSGEFRPYNAAHRAQDSGEFRPYNAAHRAQDSGEYRPYSPSHRAQNSDELLEYYTRPPTAQSQRTMNNNSPPYGGHRWSDDVEAQRGPGRY